MQSIVSILPLLFSTISNTTTTYAHKTTFLIKKINIKNPTIVLKKSQAVQQKLHLVHKVQCSDAVGKLAMTNQEEMVQEDPDQG